jgi:hypothetical protein
MERVKAVTVQFNAISVGGPYQQFQGDLCRCGGCGSEFIDRYGSNPTWEHFHKTGRDELPYAIVEERRG